MGLGKTLEILACIQINQRMNYVLKDDAQFKLELKEICNKSNLFECVCGEEPHLFYMIINKSPLEEEYDLYQCNICHVWLHSKCVNFHGSREEFVCLNCQIDLPAIPSKCTLIITPFIISHQWIEEINKRLNKKLNILFYKGAKKGFIQPRDLADLDLCLTTYDVLNAELAHTYATENSRTMRNRKRFTTVPSSLLHVEWWRICLDEAQMVHSTNSKCADMANRLQAVNRWCITGTPIGKSIADLHGLFAFIREDPYCEKRWFDELLFRPFKNKDQMTMAKEVSKVLWRNTKQFVGDQIQIPPQTEHVYWLNFSPFEVHLYECVREQFKERLALGFKDPSVNRAIKDYKGILDYNPHLRLDELDRQTINTLLAPILNLRLLCNHPQLILRRNDFMNQHGRNVDATDKFLTMEKSLDLIMKKNAS
jgi:E3 ubiquitin-protein ligase SHPRH